MSVISTVSLDRLKLQQQEGNKKQWKSDNFHCFYL